MESVIQKEDVPDVMASQPQVVPKEGRDPAQEQEQSPSEYPPPHQGPGGHGRVRHRPHPHHGQGQGQSGEGTRHHPRDLEPDAGQRVPGPADGGLSTPTTSNAGGPAAPVEEAQGRGPTGTNWTTIQPAFPGLCARLPRTCPQGRSTASTTDAPLTHGGRAREDVRAIDPGRSRPTTTSQISPPGGTALH